MNRGGRKEWIKKMENYDGWKGWCVKVSRKACKSEIDNAHTTTPHLWFTTEMNSICDFPFSKKKKLKFSENYIWRHKKERKNAEFCMKVQTKLSNQDSPAFRWVRIHYFLSCCLCISGCCCPDMFSRILHCVWKHWRFSVLRAFVWNVHHLHWPIPNLLPAFLLR